MGKKAKRPGPAAVLGGMIAGFDQQIFRSTPPPHELVHHARPDDPVPTKDGGLLVIGIPGLTPTGEEPAGATPAEEEPGTDPGQAPASPPAVARR